MERVQAALRRRYLRKLDAQEKQEAEDAEARRKGEARRTLDEYRRTVADLLAEIESLNEAVARHNQCMEDEAAIPRQYGLRQRGTTYRPPHAPRPHPCDPLLGDAPVGVAAISPEPQHRGGTCSGKRPVTPDTKAALEALQRWLGHAEAIAALLAEPNDTPLGEAIRGIAQMLDDCGNELDRIVNDKG